ncbi:MAG: ABC transporter ATP-binding protein [Terrisporobacter othiniensis]|uniref:ABC transporter ATP-binding protein/permease n=2 Tax=Terrisporobacter TaxID=1505652 RepID=A0AAX2ZBH3_9FIRM|nr:ABC transporter ATP-binding protein [Terrisporobacter hibernicus]MDU4859433.1 ABC transporter ATP-binding protein [Terrisporobacter othiniensis]MDU6993820.1 ABC transporter ATP-binding protein [Terrisporobacter othiniensis]UEL46723.1 ABC transporter ATP-binding protein/permease [Terrisporobacter hibernicus]
MKECIKKNKILLFITIIFSVISSITMVGVSLLLQSTIDKVMNGDMEGFKKILIFTLVYCGIMGLLYFIYDILSKMFIRNVTRELRSKIFSGIINHNYKDFNSKNTADYISALTNDIKLVEENYITSLLLVLQFSVAFIATIGILLYLSPLVTGCLFVSMLLIFIVPSIFGKKLESKQMNLSNKLTSFTTVIKDMLSGYDVIKSYNLKKDAFEEFEGENKDLAKTKFEADKLLVINETLSQLLGMGTQFIAVFLSAYLVLKGNITMGTLIAIVQLSGSFIQPVIMIMSYAPKITSMTSVIKRLDDMSNYKDSSFTGSEDPSFDRSIEISNVNFAYEENKNILENVDLKIKKNKKYAIVGPSGCGKSTLAKLVLGYYADYNGEIKYDDKEIRNVNIEKINKMISVIHQNVYMFDKNIKDNICLYKEFSYENISNILELSGADKFINELEEGLDYFVGENGNNLSGGQRQRIAIARALIQQTPILVLDEGTSAIDMQTGYDIESRLLNLDNLTLITITHKMSQELLSLYDEIIFMEGGKIIEQGSFNDLIKKEEKFYDFYKLETA